SAAQHHAAQRGAAAATTLPCLARLPVLSGVANHHAILRHGAVAVHLLAIGAVQPVYALGTAGALQTLRSVFGLASLTVALRIGVGHRLAIPPVGGRDEASVASISTLGERAVGALQNHGVAPDARVHGAGIGAGDTAQPFRRVLVAMAAVS